MLFLQQLQLEIDMLRGTSLQIFDRKALNKSYHVFAFLVINFPALLNLNLFRSQKHCFKFIMIQGDKKFLTDLIVKIGLSLILDDIRDLLLIRNWLNVGVRRVHVKSIRRLLCCCNLYRLIHLIRIDTKMK